MAFTGIPHGAAEFYMALEEDNSKEFWAAHRQGYEREVRDPLVALLADLEDEFGSAKIFRPHRDVRFSSDKSPYKTHQGAYVPVATATGWYIEISADGIRVGGGTYQLDAAALRAYRAGVDGPTGAVLDRIVTDLEQAGWEVGGDQVATAPRGWSRDHERIRLLRRKTLAASRILNDADIIATPRLADHVRREWRDLAPLVQWLRDIVPA
ncbi:MAG: DUF2461 domain-containing protein [Mobilicoccus sp.]|nr:DUF2461 domain-containing protein [Mobilicoccus sp.]